MEEKIWNPPKPSATFMGALIGLAALPILTDRPMVGGKLRCYREPPTPIEQRAAEKKKKIKKAAKAAKKRNR